jgi:hypothetical protein
MGFQPKQLARYMDSISLLCLNLFATESKRLLPRGDE